MPSGAALVACEEEYVSAEKDVMTSFRMATSFAEKVILREMGRTSGPAVGEYVNVGALPQFAESMRNQDASAEESRNWTLLGPDTSPPERTFRPNQYALEPLLISTWIPDDDVSSDDSSADDVSADEASAEDASTGAPDEASEEPDGRSVGTVVSVGVLPADGIPADGGDAALHVAEHSSAPTTIMGSLALFNTMVPPTCTLPCGIGDVSPKSSPVELLTL